MSLEQQIQKDIVEAMKAHDNVRLEAVRAIKSEILLAKTSGKSDTLNDDGIIRIIQKLIKQHKESADLYAAGGRPELEKNELAESEVMEKYLPKQLSEDEVETVISGIISETGAKGLSDMGKVMGIASKRLAGQSDGRTISSITKKLLG
ncbi:MAG: GatB/YqeY domain-containing protein [Bacteroidales bacterium]|jgi:uncharacterized protein YqeY|nr:GatB/YqeY domain-containing protein [Bacteroidales bacterium]MCI1784803.1 GatB/YqeY domain-containing protein [Bacteroidales bacterium]